MILACEIYQYPYDQRREIIENIFSVEDNGFSQSEKRVMQFLKDNEEVDFGMMLLFDRKATIEFFETLNRRDAEVYIKHLEENGHIRYIKCFERFLK